MLEVVNPSSYFLSLYAIPVAIVSTLIFATGFFVWLQNKKSFANIFFFLFCLSLNLWLYGIAMVYCSRSPDVAMVWYRWVTFLGVSHISPMVYTFTVHWLGLYAQQKRFVWGSFILALVFFLLAALTPYGMPYMQSYFWGFYPKYGIAGKIFLFFFFGYFFAAFYNLFTQTRRVTVPLRKKQIQLTTIAFLISITGSIDYLPKLIPIALYPLGYLSVLVWTMIVAYLIVRYQIMDIQTAIHKTIMWAFSSSLFAVPVLAFAYFKKDWLASLDSAFFAGFVLCLIFLFMAYSRFVQPVIDHIFQRRRWDLARVLEKFNDELVHLRELEELADHIVATIRGVFYAQEISLLLAKDENSAFQCSSSVPAGRKIHFERDHPFMNWLEKSGTLVLRSHLDIDPKYLDIRSDAREYFEIVNAQVCIPLIVSEKLLGIINVGQKANLKRFSTAELNFLSDLRKTAAIALSNSLRSIAMQEHLIRWNLELEKKVEERTKELKETQSQLVQAEKLASIGTLAGGIAHEINNPLTAVLTNVQMLKMTDEIQDKEALSLIEQGAKRCQQIIQKLMRYARKMGENETWEEVDINKVIQAVGEFLGYQLRQENIELSLSLGETEAMAGVSNELEQVFTNLILNSRDAIKATGRRGKIEIRTSQKNNLIQIEVRDNGIGIKKENLNRIFDPFYTTKDVGEGTGLGLTVTNGIVEKHSGRISVSSEEGDGTTFTIHFPCAKAKMVGAK